MSDAPWHCGQCVGGWGCGRCREMFSRPGDPPLDEARGSEEERFVMTHGWAAFETRAATAPEGPPDVSVGGPGKPSITFKTEV